MIIIRGGTPHTKSRKWLIELTYNGPREYSSVGRDNTLLYARAVDSKPKNLTYSFINRRFSVTAGVREKPNGLCEPQLAHIVMTL